MRKILTALTVLMLASPFVAGATPDSKVVVSDLSIKGRIEGENIVFTLEFAADVKESGVQIALAIGDLAPYGKSQFPEYAKLTREGDKFLLLFDSRGKQSVVFQFASRPIKDKEWRHTSFAIPMSNIRRLLVECDRDDLEVKFPGALKVERQKSDQGKTEVTAFMGIGDTFEVRWKPEVKKLSAEAAVECQANTIATASVGAMRLDTLFTYRIIQGSLNKLVVSVPKSVNVTQVRGADIREWALDKKDGGDNIIVVTLSRPKEDAYRLQIEGETVLSKFPCAVALPVVAPKDVIRTSGFLMVGTDSAIKLIVNKSLGLTQIDQASFIREKLESKAEDRAIPTRSSFAYQYANMPYSLELQADDIVPEYSIDDRLALAIKDNDLVLMASVELDVRDAGTRDLAIETDPAWTVAYVGGAETSDYDVREENNKRVVHVYFKKAILGRALIEIRLEHSLDEKTTSFAVPAFAVRGAKSERGHLVLAAEKGLRLRVDKDKVKGMREVHTGSVPIRIEGAQQAFRFKEAGWSATVDVERTEPGVHVEIFHLVSLGEGVLYGSSTFTYHISGAPARSFVVRIPKEYQNIEFIGRDIRSWTVDGDKWTVVLQEKAMGDFTLLATYDRQFNYRGGQVPVGGVHVEGCETEMGYIAIASGANLDISDVELDGTIIKIDADEIPQAYKPVIKDPVLKAYRYVKAPHIVKVQVARLDTKGLLTQAVDHTALLTTIGQDGDVVTTATYYTKNASEQYLVVTLPNGVERPWSTKVANDEGAMEVVPARQRKTDDGRIEVMIPIRRPRNPDAPMQVELTYPESHRIKRLGGTITLEAPTTPLTHSTFVRWTVQTTGDRVIAAGGGNVQSEYAPSGGQTSRHYLVGPNVVLGALIRILGVPFTGTDGRGFLSFVRHAVMYGDEGEYGTASFTESMNLPGGKPLSLNVTTAPLWIGPGGSLHRMIPLLAAGVVLTIPLLTRREKRRWLIAIGLTVCAFGMSQVAVGRMALTLLLAAAAALAASRLIVVYFIRRYRRQSSASGTAARSRGIFSGRFGGRRGGSSHSPASGAFSGAPVGGGTAAGQDPDAPPFEPIPPDAQQPPPASPTPPDAPSGGTGAANGRERKKNGHATNGKEGHATLRALIALATATALFASLAAPADETTRTAAGTPAAAAPPVVMDSVAMTVTGPGSGRDEEKSATIEKILEFEVDKPVAMPAVDAPGVLTSYDLGSRYAKITSTDQGYVMSVERRGRYRLRLSYLMPVTETNGDWSLNLSMPENMRNIVTLKLPETGLDVQCGEAVHLKRTETETSTETVAVFGSTRTVNFTWSPRVRKTKLEKAAYFCEVNTLASFEPGVVDLTHFVRFQIAQGELKRLDLVVPEGMSVTAVRAQDLSTWRFDPDKHLLEAVLEKPASGEFTLVVVSQVAADALGGAGETGGYNAKVGTLTVTGATRQRGSIAIATPETMQARVEDSQGLNAMNVGDFSPLAIAAAAKGPKDAGKSVKRAFRYDQLPVLVTVRAEPVLPEIRVEQTRATLSVADERIVLSTQLAITVAKAGVFSLRMGIPNDFDIETLTGEDISHWDEVKAEDERIVVHFKNQVLGTRTINLVIARMEKGIEETIKAPRVSVKGAKKHTGVLIVAGERGVRMTAVEREGVTELSPSTDLDLRQPGLLAFRLLRPAWQVTLKTEVVAPSVKPEVLHRVDLAQGMLRGTARIRYKIENAGCKSFDIRSPYPGCVLSFSGPDIAKSYEADKTNGTWRVTLHNKVQNNYTLEVSYQSPFDPKSEKALINPVQALGTEPAKGYLVIMSGGRVQVKPEGDLKGLKAEDARSVPDLFGAGDLSDAIYCFRTVQPDYRLELSVVRHESAKVLPARVRDVNMISVVADNHGNMMTRVTLRIDVGDLRFLTVRLPNPSDELWTVFVNGKVAEPALDQAAYHIPLEQSASDEMTTVEFIYAGRILIGSGGTQQYRGPQFNLPLNEIRWVFYVSPDKEYFDFDGNMRLMQRRARVGDIAVFDARRYYISNLQQIDINREKAQKGLVKGEGYALNGNPMMAKKAFKEAMIFAQGKADKEDARIQYENIVNQQAIVGLVQRRNTIRFQNNIRDDQQMEQLRGFNGGNFTPDYAKQVQQSLSAKDSEALSTLTARIIQQQDAAAGVAQAIRITVPEHGRILEFFRPIQIDPTAALMIKFRSADVSPAKKAWQVIWPALAFILIFRFMARRRARAPAA